MKKITVSLLLFLTGLLYGLDATAIPHSEFKFRPETTYENGIYTVYIYKRPEIENETVGVMWKISPQKYAGKVVRISAEVRTEGIASDTKGAHVGAKILITCVNQGGGCTWFPSQILSGTHSEWQKISAVCSVSDSLKTIGVVFGIQQAWGKLEFRNPTIEVMEDKNALSVPEGFRCEYSDEVAKLPPMRGVMSPAPHKIGEQDIRDLAEWKANLIRYQIVDGLPNDKDLKEYDRWMDSMLDKLESLMPVLKEHGIKVIIDMHHLPGGRYAQGLLLGTAGAAAAAAYGNNGRFLAMEEPEYREAYLNTWRKIARRFKGNPVVYGYDLMNEPDQNGLARYGWLELQFDAAKEIRKIDPEMPIVVEGNRFAGPGAFFSMCPLPLKNIIYSVHMYVPGEYTHQGIGNSAYAKEFPKHCLDYRKMGYDRERLKNTLKLVRDFQQKYGARILIGEFSTVIWAPGAADYLDDLIRTFEEYQWDWTYHAFREWDGWSVEHSGTPTQIHPDANTDRKQVLLKYLKQNNRP